jgi:hypothetical protein
MTTWRELERQGVKRCCVVFSSGKQCRRRASETFGRSWCDKHGPVMQGHTDRAIKALTAQATQDEEGDDE